MSFKTVCVMSCWKSVKLCLPVIGSMVDMYRLHNSLFLSGTIIKVVTRPMGNVNYNFENAVMTLESVINTD